LSRVLTFPAAASLTTSPSRHIRRQQLLFNIYLANNPNFRQYYNASSRGYPDVSAQGVNFLVVEMGVTEPVDGTNASSLAFSSIIGLLNSARIESGQKPLGFLDPFLYSAGFTALNDMTTGGSTGCRNGPAGASFNATCGSMCSSLILRFLLYLHQPSEIALMVTHSSLVQPQVSALQILANSSPSWGGGAAAPPPPRVQHR
jgi:hypothetical protein